MAGAQSKDALQTSLLLIARGGVLGMVGSVILMLINFVHQMVLARILGPVDLGFVNLGITIADILGIIVLFGLDASLVRSIAAYRAQEDKARELGAILSALRILAGISFLVVPIIWFGSGWLSEQIFVKPTLLPVLRILAINMPFDALMTMLIAITIANKRIEYKVGVEQTFVPLVKILLTLAMVYWVSRTTVAVTVVILISTVLGAALSAWMVWRLFKVQKFELKPIPVYRQLLGVSVSFMFIALLARALSQTEILILGGFSTIDQVGIYAIAFKSSFIISVFFSSLNIIFAPTISELYAKRNMRGLSFYLRILTRWSFILALPIALVMIFLSSEFIALFGNGFEAGAPILSLLAVAQVVLVATGPTGLILSMTRYANLNLVNSLLNLVLSIGLDLIFIPRFGAWGAAIGGSISISFINILRMLEVYYLMRMHPYDIHLLKPLAAGLGAAIVISWGKSWCVNLPNFIQFTLLGGIFFLIYLVLLYIFKINNDDQIFLVKLFQNYFHANRTKE
jgi:O-antigen/teichoic acid export membrane protein